MKLDVLKENLIMPDGKFPIIIMKDEHVMEGYFVPSHWHEYIEMVIVKKGIMQVRCDRRVFKAAQGTAVFINPNEIHSYEVLSEESDYDCFIFDIAFLSSGNMDSCQQKYINPIRDNKIVFNNLIKDKTVIGYAEQLVKDCAEMKWGCEMAVKARMYLIISEMLNKEHYKIAIENKDGMQNTSGKLKIILDYIEENLSEKLTLKRLSDMMEVTSCHFCHIFKEYTGQTLVDYINGLRLNRAEMMILSGSGSITDIAYACGFNDPSYFSKLYKRHKKVCPSKAKV